MGIFGFGRSKEAPPDSDGVEPRSPGPPLPLEFGLTTDEGKVRTHNEDAARGDVEMGLFVVADGMGGHEAGEVASKMAVETVFEFFRQAFADGEEPDDETLREAIRAANVLVIEASSDRPKRMGTTVTALFVRGRNFTIGHVGDSRAWRYRGGAVDQITRDHSLVSERVRRGVISPEEAEKHPQRNVLTRALGNKPDLKVDLYRGKTEPGDRFVIASDGLAHSVDADRIEGFLTDLSDPGDVSRRLVEYACEHDGSDNVTVMVVQCGAEQGDSSENETVRIVPEAESAEEENGDLQEEAAEDATDPSAADTVILP